MSLPKFYRQVGKLITDDLITYKTKNDPDELLHIKILNIRTTDPTSITETYITTDMNIGEDTSIFIRNIARFYYSLKNRKFDIINCHFSIKNFMADDKDLFVFLNFISQLLKPNGIFMGFMMDLDKLNGIFSEKPVLVSGKHKIEFHSSDDPDASSILIDGKLNKVMKLSSLEIFCQQFGMIHVDNIVLESLHKNSLSDIALSEEDKKLGFLNSVFLFQKIR